MTDKEKNSTKYLTNSKGEYILNKDGSPRKKPGRPKNSELSNIKLALQAKNKLDKKNKKVKKLTRSLARVKKEVEVEEKSLTSNVLTQSETKELPDAIQEHLDTTGEYVAFMPNEGPQTDILAASEKDIGFPLSISFKRNKHILLL